MFVLIHLVTALASMVATTYVFFTPSRAKFYTAYSMVGATLASGTYLVISTHAPILQSCTTGLMYISAISVGIALAHARWRAGQKSGR